MGCGTSYLVDGELDMLEVVPRFPCSTVASLQVQANRPQLVVGRITCAAKKLSSPYSCQECAIYRTDCFIRKELNEEKCKWEKIYSETRSVLFCLQDPDDVSSKVVHVPGKLLNVKLFGVDMSDEEFDDEVGVALSEFTPSMTAFLGRCGLKKIELSKIRIREWVVEENTQVGILGIVRPDNSKLQDECDMHVEPLLASATDKKFCLSKQDEARYEKLSSGGRSIVVLEDRKYFQGLRVRPFLGVVPTPLSYQLSNENDIADKQSASLEDISPDVKESMSSFSPKVIRQPVTGETHVRIPVGSAPGSKISVPGPRGSRLITITVPEDFQPGDTHIFKYE